MIDQKTHKLSDFQIIQKFAKYILIITYNNCHVKFLFFFLLFLTNLQIVPNASQDLQLTYKTTPNTNYTFLLDNIFLAIIIITTKCDLQS